MRGLLRNKFKKYSVFHIVTVPAGIAVMAMFLMSAAVPVLAKETPQDKFICELAVHNCLNRTKLIENRIEKLQKEIKNGNKYSPEELKIL